MPTEYRATHTEVKQRYYTCERCGAFGEVQFQAVGVGYAKDQFWQDDGADRAHMAAADQLQVDSDHVYALIRCPACKQRPKGAFTGTYFRVGIPSAIGIAGLVVDAYILIPIGFAVLGAYYLFRDLRRLGRANRAMVYKLTKPTPDPKSERKQEKDYKPLRASKASQPPRSETAPVVPVRTSAPEIVQPRGPDEGPGFLK